MSDSLRVLAVHRYFFPDAPPYASILRAIAGRWAEDGHDVEVLSTQPSYKPNTDIARQPSREWMDGFLVRRVWLPKEHGKPVVRLLNAMLFSLLTMRQILFGRYDVVMTSTAPPVVLAWAASAAARCRGAQFIYHCMDVHPEIGRVSGDFSSPALFRLLRRIDGATCRRAARVVVLSNDMASAIARRPGDSKIALETLNNFELGAPAEEVAGRTTGRGHARKLRIVFAGNVGRFQDLHTVVTALTMVRRAQCELVIMGDGASLLELKQRISTLDFLDVTFLPQQRPEAARGVIRDADLCLVSLSAGIHQYAYPSKTMTYLAEGRPLLVLMEPESELAKMVDSIGIGVQSAPGEPEALAGLLDEVATDPRRLDELTEAAELKGRSLFDRANTLDRWSTMLMAIGRESVRR